MILAQLVLPSTKTPPANWHVVRYEDFGRRIRYARAPFHIVSRALVGIKESIDQSWRKLRYRSMHKSWKMSSDDYAAIRMIADALAKDMRISNEWRAICEIDAEVTHEEKEREKEILS